MVADLRSTRFESLDLLASAILITSDAGRVVFVNSALEALFNTSRRNLEGQAVEALFGDSELAMLFRHAQAHHFDQKRQDISVTFPGREPVSVHSTVVALHDPGLGVLFEFREIDQQLRLDRETRFIEQGLANRELIRNLAHEIKNPLGGIRGAAQLLELEIAENDRAVELREYTQVIVKEADRLQTLVDRLLAPHRKPQFVADVNIHEVCERVRAVLLAEFPQGLAVHRDYDASAPEFRGDKEQLIQALLNIAHNAAHALKERIAARDARIVLRTRVARNVTVSRRRCRLALDLHVIDNGPGIPEEIRDRIFFPLVSGREGGSGLGLTLAQTYVQQHQGVIECESRPGLTDFRILLPLD